MAVQRIPAYWQSAPYRASSLVLYNSPGSGQYKWMWHSFIVPHTGVLRELAYRIESLVGSPTMRWAVYSQLPDDPNINALTPIASGDISSFTDPYTILTSDLGLSVVRGQPIAVKLGCVAGTSFSIQGATNTAPMFGITNPGGTVFASTDDVTYSAFNSSYLKHVFTMTMTIQDNDGTYRFMTSFTAGTTTFGALDGPGKLVALSFRLGKPVIVSGFRVRFYPGSSPLMLGTMRFELRPNNPDFTPVMSGSPIAYKDYKATNFTYPGSDSELTVLFDDDVLISDGNFALVYYWASHVQGSGSTRGYYTETTYVSEMLGSVYKSLYSSDGGSTWTEQLRLPHMDIMWRHYADSLSSGAGSVIVPGAMLGGM